MDHQFEIAQRTDKTNENNIRSKDGIYLQDNRVVQQKNNTGLPDKLKAGVENLSGLSMNDVNVHYNSSRPAQLNALAYAQGTDIHIATGQEKHLPHEAWHIVQQKQGRVKPTIQMKGEAINDDKALETEAGIMGSKAMDIGSIEKRTSLAETSANNKINVSTKVGSSDPLQRVVEINGVIYNSQADVQTIINNLKASKLSLSEKQTDLLENWVMARGPLSPLGLRLYNGIDKKYPDLEELYMALAGTVSAAKNLQKETDFAKTITGSAKLKNNLNSLAQKIYLHIENVKNTLPKNNVDFWKEASSSYRNLWNYVGVPYNLNYYLSTFGAISGGMNMVPPPSYKKPIDAFKDTLSQPTGNATDIFSSIKQVSNVYNERKVKRDFQTPRLVLTDSGKIEAVPGMFETSGEKRYNTQSLKEKENWTRHARKKNIPISAGASGSMDRMYRLAQDSGATQDELIALALAGHYVFNQVYTKLSNDPHTFHEIMDTLHPYMNPATSFPLSHHDRLKKMENWL